MNLVCDLDGVVYLGGRAIPGSAEALKELTESGWQVVFCTNNSSRTPTQVAAKLADVTGFEAEPSQVITSAQAAATLLASQRPPTLVLGGDGIREALTEVGIRLVERAVEAEAVVVGLALDLSYSSLREAVRAVVGGARLIATNLDATYPSEDGPWPGGGAIVAAVETASGVKAEPAGKPWPPMRALIQARLAPGSVWVVGDRPDTDLALAREAGWSAALVLSGVTRPDDDIRPAPDLVVADLAEAARRIMARVGNQHGSWTVDTNRDERTA